MKDAGEIVAGLEGWELGAYARAGGLLSERMRVRLEAWQRQRRGGPEDARREMAGSNEAEKTRIEEKRKAG